jgi:hypothetical protein
MSASAILETLDQAPAPAALLLAPLATAPRAIDWGRTLDVSTTPTLWISCAAQTGNGFTWSETADSLLEAETVGRRVGDSRCEACDEAYAAVGSVK